MADTRRWSEVIPPHSALTFAAMYDPAEGIITFSGGSLLDSSSDSGYLSASSPSKYSQFSDSPREAYDDQSQVLTIDRLAYALGTVPNSAALALEQGLPFTFKCEALESGAESLLLHSYGPEPWKRRPQAIHIGSPEHHLYVVNGPTSSDSSDTSEEQHTLGEKDSSQPRIEWSHLRELGNKLLSAAKTPFDGRMFHLYRSESSEGSHDSGEADTEDEGFFEDACLTAASFYTAPLLVNLNLKSTFSVTTTSTSPFVNVSAPSVCPSGQHHSPHSPHVHNSRSDDHNTVIIPIRNRSTASETWRTPTLDAFEFLEGDSPNSPNEFRRRLKKMRRYPPPIISHSHSSHSSNEPASPDEVLARNDYNHVSPCSSPGGAASPRPRPGLRRQKSFTAKVRKSVVEKLTKLVPSNLKEEGDERWVWVEVTHKVTHHVLSVPPA